MIRNITVDGEEALAVDTAKELGRAKQAVAAGRHASTIRRHMTGRPGAVTRRG